MVETEKNNSNIQDTPENVRILNEKLGITSRENLFNSAGVASINELFESSKRDFELLCKDIAEHKEDVNDAESIANDSFNTFREISKSGSADDKIAVMESTAVAVSNFADTISSMKNLVERGNDIMAKLYDAIVNTDILDPDLLSAVANIIHSIRETNDNLIQFNVSKMTLEQQYKLAIDTEQLKHRHALEKEYFKWKLQQQTLETKARIKREEEDRKPVMVSISDNSDTAGKHTWNQSTAAEMMRKSIETENDRL